MGCSNATDGDFVIQETALDGTLSYTNIFIRNTIGLPSRMLLFEGTNASKGGATASGGKGGDHAYGRFGISCDVSSNGYT
jgi:hypothetical protein